MKFEKLCFNETVIVFDQTPFVLRKCVPTSSEDTFHPCEYCHLRKECVNEDGISRFYPLCTPTREHNACCFVVDWERLPVTLDSII